MKAKRKRNYRVTKKF